MKRISALVFCFVLASASVVHSQTLPVKTVPDLTQVEKLKIENIQLKFAQALQAEKSAQELEAALRAQYQELLTSVEKENPGYTLDPTTGKLVVKPEEKKPVETKK